MSWESAAQAALDELSIDLVAYLPDSAVAGLIERIEADDSFDTVPVAREEEGVGVLSGAWLAGRRGALVCQSSGLANTFNALGSVCKAARIPFLGIVTHRGDLGDHNLAHAPAEYPMPQLLDSIGIRNHCLDAGMDVERRLVLAGETAFSQEEPYVTLLESPLLEAQA